MRNTFSELTSDQVGCLDCISIFCARYSFQCYGIKKDDLLALTARTFGFNRKGDNINQAMQAAYSYLLENKKITEIDDCKVVVL